MRRGPFAALAALLAVVLAACANTIDPEVEAPRTSSEVAATTYVAEGTTAELLQRLLDDSRHLSERIIDNEGDNELLARIDATWAAARPGVDDAAPDLVDDVERALAMLHNGVNRRRPADADKGSRNLEAVVDRLDV